MDDRQLIEAFLKSATTHLSRGVGRVMRLRSKDKINKRAKLRREKRQRRREASRRLDSDDDDTMSDYGGSAYDDLPPRLIPSSDFSFPDEGAIGVEEREVFWTKSLFSAPDHWHFGDITLFRCARNMWFFLTILRNNVSPDKFEIVDKYLNFLYMFGRFLLSEPQSRREAFLLLNIGDYPWEPIEQLCTDDEKSYGEDLYRDFATWLHEFDKLRRDIRRQNTSVSTRRGRRLRGRH